MGEREVVEWENVVDVKSDYGCTGIGTDTIMDGSDFAEVQALKSSAAAFSLAWPSTKKVTCGQISVKDLRAITHDWELQGHDL